jgi:hypothetical protein
MLKLQFKDESTGGKLLKELEKCLGATEAKWSIHLLILATLPNIDDGLVIYNIMFDNKTSERRVWTES